jgi:hypothetical protein
LAFATAVAVGAAIWGNLDWWRNRVDINVNRFNQFKRTKIADNTWRHNPRHRGNVPYRDPRVGHRFGDAGRTKARDAYRGKADAGRRDLAKTKIGEGAGKAKAAQGAGKAKAAGAGAGAKAKSAAAGRAKQATRDEVRGGARKGMLGLPEAPRGMRHAPGRSPIGREPLPTGRKCAAMDRGRARTAPSAGVADTVSAWVGVASEAAASAVAAEAVGGAGDEWCRRR